MKASSSNDVLIQRQSTLSLQFSKLSNFQGSQLLNQQTGHLTLFRLPSNNASFFNSLAYLLLDNSDAGADIRDVVVSQMKLMRDQKLPPLEQVDQSQLKQYGDFTGQKETSLLARHFGLEVVLVNGTSQNTGQYLVFGSQSQVKKRVYMMQLDRYLFEPVVFVGINGITTQKQFRVKDNAIQEDVLAFAYQCQHIERTVNLHGNQKLTYWQHLTRGQNEVGEQLYCGLKSSTLVSILFISVLIGVAVGFIILVLRLMNLGNVSF